VAGISVGLPTVLSFGVGGMVGGIWGVLLTFVGAECGDDVGTTCGLATGTGVFLGSTALVICVAVEVAAGRRIEGTPTSLPGLATPSPWVMLCVLFAGVDMTELSARASTACVVNTTMDRTTTSSAENKVAFRLDDSNVLSRDKAIDLALRKPQHNPRKKHGALLLSP
jgi:hypothetical protein